MRDAVPRLEPLTHLLSYVCTEVSYALDQIVVSTDEMLASAHGGMSVGYETGNKEGGTSAQVVAGDRRTVQARRPLDF